MERRSCYTKPKVNRRPHFREPPLEARDPNLRLVVGKAALHVDAGDEGDVQQLGVAEVVAAELIAGSWRIEPVRLRP